MATLNFYLDKPDKEGKCPILMTYLANGKKFRHSVKYKTFPGQWLTKKQQIRVIEKEDQFVNSHLDSLNSIITDAQKESLLIYNKINFDFVREKFSGALDKKEVKQAGVKQKDFIGYFNEYIEVAAGKIKPLTIKRYIATLNHLLAFRKVKRFELSFERMDSEFYEKFVNYLTVDRNLLNNSVGGYVKVVKSFLNFATDKGYNKTGLQYKKFKVFKEESDLIYLTEAEVMKLVYLEEGMTERLRIVRDNFCFACFTGLRYSDISILKPENIKEGVVLVKTEKTKDFLQIPLNRFAKEVLARNNGHLPKLASNQKTNDALKELGKLAGLNEMVHIIKYRGIEKVEFLEPKYNFIGTHTARRTFVTLCLEKGMRPEVVMSITGHKDYKSFKKYIKLTDKVKSVEMNKIWETNLFVA
ncbi:site-specific integrase [Mucilaginibacter arboris]|uniref:Tyrosine-type recombinase/integrase n=1 Tax=Mucilaginibacter arboris TaxID=2682090 RepID=A0A7K1ST46_9SPHI|nr:site-specific integrase [Mucilaginibacter arboris]MVN20427.1 tyrosine-type recombinase/integrase [Mucilaginibacter arboris]